MPQHLFGRVEARGAYKSQIQFKLLLRGLVVTSGLEERLGSYTKSLLFYCKLPKPTEHFSTSDRREPTLRLSPVMSRAPSTLRH